MPCPLQKNKKDRAIERRRMRRGEKEDVNPQQLETIEHLTTCPRLGPARILWDGKKNQVLSEAKEKDGDEAWKFKYEVSETSRYLYLLREAMLLMEVESYEEEITVNRTELKGDDLELARIEYEANLEWRRPEE